MSHISPSSEPHRFTPLRVASSGICCPVGNYTAAVSAAIRGRLNHFQPSRFVDDTGSRVKLAMLHDVPVWGQARLQYMYRLAMTECLAGLALSDEQSLPPIILIGAERERGVRFHRDMVHLLTSNRPEEDYDPRTILGCLGKAGITNALIGASQMFAGASPPAYVIIVGVDSFLDGASITHFLEQERILCSSNPDGFIPGEAAAAIALTPTQSPEPALWVEGVGTAHESANLLDTTTPLRAIGLTQALRTAIQSSDCNVGDFLFHASAISGEQWYFKEAGLAMDRVMTEKMAKFPHRTVAQSVGEIGAAFGPLMLSWIGDEMKPQDDNLGPRGLLHFANDNGQRAALAVHYH